MTVFYNLIFFQKKFFLLQTSQLTKNAINCLIEQLQGLVGGQLVKQNNNDEKNNRNIMAHYDVQL